ncbi:MAG: hypothetical protein J5654_02520 [Victivallales bacterium]|nr:hypothetical protein [Victivallales bacterium]
MRRLLPILCLAFAGVLVAESMLNNGDFELNDQGWFFPECARTEAFAGRDGTAALRFQRLMPAKEDAVALSEMMALLPGHCYTLEAWAKSETLKDGAPRLGVKFATGKKGKTLLPGSAKCIALPETAQDWTRLCLDFTVPSQATSTKVNITFPRQVTGTVWLDRLSVKPANYPFTLALLYPTQGIIDENTSVLRIAVAKPGEFDLAKELVHKTLRLNQAGHPHALRSAAPIVEFPLKLASQQEFLNATVELLDNDSQRVLVTLRINLRVLHGQDALPDTSVTIDSRQRTVIQGQTVLPIGLVATSAANFPTNSPFQFLLPTPAAIDAIHSPAELKHFLDTCHRHGLRTILPVDDKCWPWLNDPTPIAELRRERLLTDCATHPAVAAWMLAPDTPFDGKTHYQVNRMDCNHPVCQVLDGTRLTSNYLCNGDGLIGYLEPLAKEHPEEMLTQARTWIDELVETRLPVWMVLHFPVDTTETFENLRTLALLAAAQGAKGFFFVPPLSENIIQLLDNQYINYIDIASEIACILQDLSPYLLSNNPVRDIPVTVKKGNAIAREFTDAQGKRVILLVGGFLPGKTHVTLNLPKNATVTSRFGATKPQRNGVWTFEGKGLCADILEIEDTATK